MSLIPGVYEPPLREGIRFRKTATFSDSDGPLDFASCTFRAQVRRRPNADGEPFISVTDEVGDDGQITVVGPGSVEVYFSKEATSRLKGVKRFSWDLIVYWPGGVDNDCLLTAVDVIPAQTTTEPTV